MVHGSSRGTECWAVWHNAMVYHDEYVTTDVVACAPEQGWVIRSIRPQPARQRPCRRRQRPPGRGDRGLDLRAAARQQLGTLGDPAASRNKDDEEGAAADAAAPFVF